MWVVCELWRPSTSRSGRRRPPVGGHVARGAELAPDVRVAPGAVILERARIGSGSLIGPNAVVYADAVVGQNCELGANVVVYGGVTLGARVTVGAGAVLGRAGFGFTTAPHGEMVRVPQLGGVVIEDDVEIGRTVYGRLRYARTDPNPARRQARCTCARWAQCRDRRTSAGGCTGWLRGFVGGRAGAR